MADRFGVAMALGDEPQLGHQLLTERYLGNETGACYREMAKGKRLTFMSVSH